MRLFASPSLSYGRRAALSSLALRAAAASFYYVAVCAVDTSSMIVAIFVYRALSRGGCPILVKARNLDIRQSRGLGTPEPRRSRSPLPSWERDVS